MNEKALQILEFPRILDQLEQCAQSAPGRALCRGCRPLTDAGAIEPLLVQTEDALGRLLRSGEPTLSGITDLRPMLQRLDVGSSLNITELLAVGRLLECASSVRSYGTGQEQEDSLSSMFRVLEPLPSLRSELDRCILSEDEIADDASPALRQVRRGMRQAQDKIRGTLNSLINGSARTYLQEPVVTQRNGRYCVPVKMEYRSQVPGMIHDQSSSGSTLFIEPMSVVRLNNEVRELEIQEVREIEKVLSALSARVHEGRDALLTDLSSLVQLDYIFARSRLARRQKATKPILNEDGLMDLKKARHPLIDPARVVPIDIRLGDGFDLLVISGPNTGGKTVSLKTAGLLTAMAQSGLFIPAAEHSGVSVYHEIFADIGDEQSIEQSLSTFSAHMTNIVSFWQEADERSLVLFDELGAGTDPTEGAALAISILSDLHARGIHTMATTHYSELKIFALSTPGVENACCEFDVATLRPTYRLLIGVPGKSNAFAISSKLGLPDYIIEDARSRISQEEQRFEDVVTDLEQARTEAEQERDKAERYRREAQQQRQKLLSQQQRLDTSRDKILDDARREAMEILREAKETADETIRRMNKLASGKAPLREMEQQRTRLRDEIGSLQQSVSKPSSGSGRKARADRLKIGDRVRVRSMNLEGTIATLPDQRGRVTVQMGLLKSQVQVSDLDLVDESTVSYEGEPAPGSGRGRKGRKAGRSGSSGSYTSTGQVLMSKSRDVRPEINLLGLTVSDAIEQLDKYIDDACMAGLTTVRVVHGKGTGTLRKAVHDWLRRQKRVQDYRLGEFGEGDSGVTIVTLK